MIIVSQTVSRSRSSRLDPQFDSECERWAEGCSEKSFLFVEGSFPTSYSWEEVGLFDLCRCWKFFV